MRTSDPPTKDFCNVISIESDLKPVSALCQLNDKYTQECEVYFASLFYT
jgi:hypothetical protein